MVMEMEANCLSKKILLLTIPQRIGGMACSMQEEAEREKEKIGPLLL